VQVDVFALGSVTFSLITKDKPFDRAIPSDADWAKFEAGEARSHLLVRRASMSGVRQCGMPASEAADNVTRVRSWLRTAFMSVVLLCCVACLPALSLRSKWCSEILGRTRALRPSCRT
jgi:hypothetical protein